MSIADLDSEAAPGPDAEPIEVQVVDTAGTQVPHPTVTDVAVIDPTEPPGTKMIPGSNLPIVPGGDELRYLGQMATTLAYANACPSAMRGKPNDVFLVLLSARDLGVAITTAMREFHVIEGRVTISPKSKLAMVRASGLGKVWPDPGNNDEAATWYATRNDMGDLTFSATFTMAMAKTAKLLGKDKSAWTTYPHRMLSWRAVGYLMDDVFGEVATGLYSPDELGAAVNDDGELIIDVTSVGALPGMKGQPAPGIDETPATDDEKAALQTRIDAITDHHDDARKALVALWTHRQDDGPPRLPPMRALMRRHLSTANQVITTVEQRIGRGEWEPTSDPEPAAGALGAGGEAPTPTDPPAGPETGTDLQLMLAEVEGWTRLTLDEQCKKLGVATRGAMPVVKDRYRQKLRDLAAEEAGA